MTTNDTTVQIENDTVPPERGGVRPGEEEQPFSIADHREKCVTCMWVTFFASVICLMIGLTLHITGVIYSTPDPTPAFIVTNLTADGAYSYEFFGDRRTWNASRDICFRRRGQLIVFESSSENSLFNDFVESTFKSYTRNLEGNPFKRSGLQIWTGIGALFRAMKQTQLVLMSGDPMINLPQGVQRFYTESSEFRICMANDLDRIQQYRRAMASKRGVVHYIVKDFTGKFESVLKEPGCFNIRIVHEAETLLLPFVCKRKN